MNIEYHRKRLDILKIRRSRIEKDIQNTKQLIQKMESEKECTK